MTTAEVNDLAWLARPFTWRNNRGTAQTKDGRFIRFGIPEPRGRETEDDLKGGDRLGFIETVITPDMVGRTVAVFANIEIKGDGDRLKPGQIGFHNFILRHGGISEIWHGDGHVEGDVICE